MPADRYVIGPSVVVSLVFYLNKLFNREIMSTGENGRVCKQHRDGSRLRKKIHRSEKLVFVTSDYVFLPRC